MKKSLLFVFSVLLFNPVLSYGQSKLDSLLSAKIKVNPTHTIIYIDSLMAKKSSRQEIPYLTYHKAFAYKKIKDYKNAIKYFEKSLHFFPENHQYHIKALLYLSSLKRNLHNYIEATAFALKAKNLSQKNNYTKQIVQANSSLAHIHFLNKDYDNSLKYLLNSIDINIKTNDSIGLSTTFNNMAIVYKNMGNFNKAIEFNNKALTISVLKKDTIGIGKSYTNIGRLYEHKGDQNTAFEYYKKAIEINAKANITNSIPYRNISDMYFANKDYVKCENYLLKALEIEQKNKKSAGLPNIFKSLHNNALYQKDFKKALYYQSKTDSLNNLRLKKENEEKIKALENQHLLFQKEKKLEQEKSINFKNKIIFITVGLVIFLLAVYLYQKNKNKALKLEKDKIRLEQKVLRSQMNPHFIFNSLSAIQNSLLDNDPLKSAMYLAKFAKLIRQNFDFINQKTITLEEEIDALKNYMDTQKLRFQDKFEYQFIMSENLDPHTIEIPPLLLQPFVENSIEHGFKNKKEKGKITIKIDALKDQICYTIADNGKGFKDLNNDKKEHAIDVFRKRIDFLNTKNHQFTMESNATGTTIKFCLDQ